ncbi:MAG: 4-hydroxy-tetrahydrodipicolinate synthase [Oscillospiraceae bacterium]|nr:4-hydroxy-tetrahydrodipicolinate synthase [Oscillospiraceae bacterium]
MTEKAIFTGAGTALITPTTEDGVDFVSLGRLIDWQIESGIDALIICGTTGEKSTLDDAEHKAVLEFSLERAAGRVPMIAGTGSNDTRYGLQMTRHACELGYDGVLVMTPYYNKSTQAGLVRNFTAYADAASAPVILYNVPSRTGVNIEPETYAALADHPMIAGIKEASGNISKLMETVALVGDRLDVYSGNDDQIVPIIACGGKGVISVLSNIAPAETSLMCRLAMEGDMAGAMALQTKYLPVIKSLFCEVNPIPVKAALHAMGYCENYLRLPLVPMEEAHEKTLRANMKAVGLL